MAIQERLNHALHNETVCELLFQSNKFDWTITTAFYSALHYVQNKIFPLKQRTKDGKSKFEIPSFNSYCKSFNPLQKAKHELLIELVENYCSEISPEYNWLYDTCRNARYHDYNLTQKTAQKALDCLKKIKNHCSQ